MWGREDDELRGEDVDGDGGRREGGSTTRGPSDSVVDNPDQQANIT